ncbi:MAG: glycosyltransferase family 2 protein [Candidatus Bathyarchaeia archaeon]
MNEKPLGMTSKRTFVVACIPAFNEEKTVAKIVILAQKHVNKVIVCDDGSSDLTDEIAERLGAEVIRHNRNMGYGAALISLFNRARELGADIMVTLDADGQHNPDDIPKLVKPIVNGEADIVIGSRFLGGSTEEAPKSRVLGIKIITKLANAISYEELTDAQSGFRAYGRRAIELIRPKEQGMGVSMEILLKAKENGLKIKEVPINVNYKVEKPSTHNPIYHGLDVILSTIKYLSIRHPLLFYGVPGVIMLLTAIGFWIWTIQIFSVTRQVITNIVLIAIGATIVGLIIMTTAVILWVLASLIREIK